MPTIKFNDFISMSVPKDTVFILDTNVLYYVHSGYYLPNSQNCQDYSNIVQFILTNGYSVKVSSLNIQELMFGIENKEYLIYCENNSLNKRKYSKKDFRKNDEQRKLVKEKLKTVLDEITSVYTVEDGLIKATDIKEFVDRFELHKMDPIDYLLTKNFEIANIFYVSADKDFSSIRSLNVLTAT